MCLGGFLFQWSAAWVCHTCLKMIYTAHRTYTDGIQCTTECASLQCQSSSGLYFSLNLLYFVFPSVFIVKSNVLTIRQVIKKERGYTVILLQIFFLPPPLYCLFWLILFCILVYNVLRNSGFCKGSGVIDRTETLEKYNKMV